MLSSMLFNSFTIQVTTRSTKQFAFKQAHAMKSFLSFRGSRAGFFSDLFTGESCPLRILRLRRSCGFPHTQVAKRTAPSRQSLQKGFHGGNSQENSQWMQIIKCSSRYVISRNGHIKIQTHASIKSRPLQPNLSPPYTPYGTSLLLIPVEDFQDVLFAYLSIGIIIHHHGRGHATGAQTADRI